MFDYLTDHAKLAGATVLLYIRLLLQTLRRLFIPGFVWQSGVTWELHEVDISSYSRGHVLYCCLD